MAAVAGFATRAAGAAAKAGEGAAVAKAASGRAPRVKVKRGVAAGAQRPVFTTMTVVVGAGLLRAWLVEKKAMPGRDYWVKIALLGFVLALLAETVPKLGKGIAYLTLTTVTFSQSLDLLKAMQELEKPATTGPSDAAPDTMPAKLAGTNLQTITLYSRGFGPQVGVAPGRSDPHRRDWPRPHRYKDPQGPRGLPPNTA